MEVLNLLKFWKTSPPHGEENSINSTTCNTTHIDLSIDGSDNEIDEEDSFFELEITAPDYDNEKNRDVQEENNIKKHKNGENVEDFKEQSKTCFAQNDLVFSESNLSRFKCRRILPIEPNSKPQSPISILKSAPKFRIFTLGFNSSKTRKTEKTEETRVAMETPKQSQHESKKFTLKINVEQEEGPSPSMFTRVNSSRTTGSKLQKQSTNESSPIDSSKRFSKDVVQKYLKLIKPFYVKVSKRDSDRVKLSDLMSTSSPASSPAPVVSPKNVPSSFRVLSKHLGKSRSASAAVGVVSPAESRRDDSLLQQDDGIQSAILHCKRSFNSSRRESCQLSPRTSDTSHEKLTEPWRKSTEEADGC